jgi:phosphoribosyl 1,2-cyclic phosphodiesterase
MLKFIGSGSAFNTKLGNTSAYIKENGVLLLIDCGELTFDRILKMNLLDGVTEIHVAVTHTHPDHIGSLGSFIFYCYYIKKIKPIFHAANTNFIELLNIMGVTSKHCIFNNCEFKPIDRIKSLISFCINKHVDELTTFGILIAQNDNVIYYSGDSCEIEDYILNAFKRNNICRLYQDTCKTNYEGNPHMSLRKITEIIPLELRDKVYCMHLDDGFIPDEAKALGFNVVENEK